VCLLQLHQYDPKASSLSKINNPRIFPDQCCKSFLSLLGAKPVNQRKANVKKITEWVNLDPVEKRKYYFLNKKRLVDLCVEELHGSKTSFASKKVSELIELLAQPRVEGDHSNVVNPDDEPTRQPTQLKQEFSSH